MQEIFHKQLLKSACASKWKRLGVYPHHGIIIMLSSLHSKNGACIGEFLDLTQIIEWGKKVGLDFIQLLPLNDTGFDNSPYNPISTFALNPVYLSLYALPHLDEDTYLKKLIKKLQSEKLTEYVDYAKVRAQKFDFLRKYYDHHFDKIKKCASYKLFLKKNSWAFDYALFCALSAHYKTERWSLWPSSAQKLTPKHKKVLLKLHEKEIHFSLMIQFFCFEQLKSVHDTAQKNKISLFGDLPFLVSKDSCVTWAHPDLFLMDTSVGSPPDSLTPDGQNWDFPAYNWDALIKSDYRWWKERLRVAENFFDIYRLDHIIGFFRTWNIPKGKKGADGAFSPQDPNTWLDHGKNFLLKLIKSSEMMPIGEDLVIPQTIKDVLRELGICGTNILTWQRTGAGGADFVPYPLYVAATITHIASHDTATLQQWWTQYPEVSKQFCIWKKWKYTKILNYQKRFEILYDSHHTSSLFHSNLLQEYLALFPEMVHKDYHKERINYPGTPSKNNWRNRLILSVEEIVNSRKLSEVFKALTR